MSDRLQRTPGVGQIAAGGNKTRGEDEKDKQGSGLR
jgi:hypothetical protein